MTLLGRLQNSRNALGFMFMLPAAVLLLLFLTYPLGLGTWLGFTDAKVGRPGEWIGLENYQFLWNDAVTRLALFNTLFYTAVASVFKFFLGLWLAVLLNKNIRFKTFFRAVILLPLAVPGLISAGIFAFTLSWNEFIYALTFVSSSEVKTVPVGVVTELVEGDVYHWGALMAGALLGSLPVAIIYSFFVEYYVSGLTGAVKE